MARNNNQVIFITIDTEGDNLWEWKEGDPITTNNLLYLMQFQLLCEKYLIKPIYLMNYEAASDLRWCDFISKKAKEGLCEIGLHLHAWNTPPYYSLPNVLNGNPYITEYPKNIISQKITSTISLIYKNCGIKVKSHRSGRWAYSNEYFEELKKQGICVDCSFVPGIDLSQISGRTSFCKGANYKNVKNKIFELESGLLEIPLTTVKTRMLLSKSFSSKIKTLLLGKVFTLRPTGLANNALVKIAHKCKQRNFIEFMIHSSELMPGGSPYYSTKKDIDVLLNEIEKFFLMLKKYSVRSMTFIDYLKDIEKNG